MIRRPPISTPFPCTTLCRSHTPEQIERTHSMLDQKTLRTIFELDAERAHRRWIMLTRREREVAEKMSRDWTNKAIPPDLRVSPQTLDIHRTNVKQKLAAKTS